VLTLSEIYCRVEQFINKQLHAINNINPNEIAPPNS
jgi:hypothetical protein